MRRVSSYGGPSGVPGSERLKQRLSSTPGLHLLSSNSLVETGFLAAVGDPQDERVIHRTFGAARNFYAISSNLKQVAKRGSWVTRKDPFAALVKETTIFDEPLDADQHCKGEVPAAPVEEGDRKHHSTPGVLDNGARAGGVEGTPPDVPSSDSQVVEKVELEEAIGTSSSSDRLSNASTSASLDTGNDVQETHSESLLGSHQGLHLETEPSSVALAEAAGSLSTSPTIVGQDARTCRPESCEADTADNVDLLGHEKSLLPETWAVLEKSENGRSKDMAAVKIQSCWKGWHARKHFKQVKDRVVFLQSLVRRNQEFKLYNGISQAAIVLQKHWRVFQSVQVLKRLKTEHGVRERRRINNAAIVVQTHWRSAQSRRLADNLRKERHVRVQQRNGHAAVVVQKHWRARQGRCLVKNLKIERVLREQQRIGDAAVVLQKHWRARRGRFLLKHLRIEQAVKEKQRTDNAAVVLQKHWRAQQGRRLVKILNLEQVVRQQQGIDNATVVLQKHWRAKQGRCFLKHLKLERAAWEQLRRDNAAIMLQKHWRGKQGWRLVKHLRMEQAAREQQRTNNAAVVIQKHVRAKQGRGFLKHLQLEQAAREQLRKDNAAIVLQKHLRAKQGRRVLKHLKLEQTAREQLRKDNAAIVLQKYVRAKQGRRFLKHLKLEQTTREQLRIDNAAIVLQKHWRGKQGWRLVKYLRMEQAAREQQRTNNAAIVLQKHLRAKQGRRVLKHLKLEQTTREQLRQDNAAIMLQKHWRAQQSRALVEHVRTEQLVRQHHMDHAAIVLQKHWRGRQSRCLVKNLTEKKQLVNNAVVVVQKCWRAQQSRLTVKLLRLELAARERHRATAATTLQNHWRARQRALLLARMKMAEAIREQQTLDNAAIIVQKHWRGRHCRLLVKHLKREQALREEERLNNAAVVLQKYWRGFQSRQLVKFLYTEQSGREERAALCIEARVRGNATRVKFKAALTIQKAWQLYWSSRVTLSAVSIHQHPLSSSTSDQKRKIQAIIVLQAYARGFVARRRLDQMLMPKSANVSLRPDQTDNDTSTETGDSLESSRSSSIVHHVDAGVRLVDKRDSSSDRWQDLECAPITSQKQDLSVSLAIDHGEFSATCGGDGQLQKNGVQEDWNDVAVDHLEECLDTCLAALRPLPSSGSQHCLPGLDVPEKSVQTVENKENIDGISTSHTELSTSTCEIVHQDVSEAGNEPSHLIKSAPDAPKIQSDHVMSQAASTGPTDHLEISSRPVHETGTQQMENPAQVKNVGRQTLKQNEERLKQFAQVFLLQRHIALQQQRAQAAPPFPPPMPSGSENSSHTVTQSLENKVGDEQEAALQIAGVHADAQPREVEGKRLEEEEHHVVCEIVDPDDDQQIESRRSQACQNPVSKQIIDRPRPDVVLDMVLLLRRIEEEYGTSEGDFEGESSTWCTPGCGDVEEGIPFLDRNSGSVRRQSSVAKFANAVNIKQISISDVNAVLLVFIAMVVYTRTVCKGLFFGARQTHRRP